MTSAESPENTVPTSVFASCTPHDHNRAPNVTTDYGTEPGSWCIGWLRRSPRGSRGYPGRCVQRVVHGGSELICAVNRMSYRRGENRPAGQAHASTRDPAGPLDHPDRHRRSASANAAGRQCVQDPHPGSRCRVRTLLKSRACCACSTRCGMPWQTRTSSTATRRTRGGTSVPGRRSRPTCTRPATANPAGTWTAPCRPGPAPAWARPCDDTPRRVPPSAIEGRDMGSKDTHPPADETRPAPAASPGLDAVSRTALRAPAVRSLPGLRSRRELTTGHVRTTAQCPGSERPVWRWLADATTTPETAASPGARRGDRFEITPPIRVLPAYRRGNASAVHRELTARARTATGPGSLAGDPASPAPGTARRRARPRGREPGAGCRPDRGSGPRAFRCPPHHPRHRRPEPRVLRRRGRDRPKGRCDRGRRRRRRHGLRLGHRQDCAHPRRRRIPRRAVDHVRGYRPCPPPAWARSWARHT